MPVFWGAMQDTSDGAGIRTQDPAFAEGPADGRETLSAARSARPAPTSVRAGAAWTWLAAEVSGANGEVSACGLDTGLEALKRAFRTVRSKGRGGARRLGCIKRTAGENLWPGRSGKRASNLKLRTA